MDDTPRASVLLIGVDQVRFHSFAADGCKGGCDVHKAEWVCADPQGLNLGVAPAKCYRHDRSALKEQQSSVPAADHPNVVKCFGLSAEQPCVVVTELCSGGSLGDLLHGSRPGLTLRQKVKISLDVASGMEHLYKQLPGLAHGSLTSFSVMLAEPVSSADQEVCAKVAGFGLSRKDSQGEQMTQPCLSGVGAWRWASPEVFELDEDAPVCDEPADVFSFAMVMYEVMTGGLPYHDKFPDGELPDPRVGLHICLGLRPSLSHVSAEWPAQLGELMRKCWAEDPADRPSFAEARSRLAGLYG